MSSTSSPQPKPEPMDITIENINDFKLPPGLKIDKVYNKKIKNYPNLPVGDLRQQVVYLLMFIDNYDDVYNELRDNNDELVDDYNRLVIRCESLSSQLESQDLLPKPPMTDASTETVPTVAETASQVVVSTMDSATQMDVVTPSLARSKRTSISNASEEPSSPSTRPKKRRKNRGPDSGVIDGNGTIPMDTTISSAMLPTMKKPKAKKFHHGQCFNCQLFGHVAAACENPPRCVKCGKDHASNTCTKPKDIPPCCSNCSKEHTSSYRGCPIYKEYIKNNPKSRKPSAKKKKRPSHDVSSNFKNGLSQIMATFLPQVIVAIKELIR